MNRLNLTQYETEAYGTIVHLCRIKNDIVQISVSSLSEKRTEIIVAVNPTIHKNNKFHSINGTSGLSALIEIKRVMPSIVSWIKSIGRTPIADPADIKRFRAFAKHMQKFGIQTY